MANRKDRIVFIFHAPVQSTNRIIFLDPLWYRKVPVRVSLYVIGRVYGRALLDSLRNDINVIFW